MVVMVMELAMLAGAGMEHLRAEPATGPVDTLTVEECIHLARRNAPAVRAAHLEQQAAANDSAALSFNRRPSFALTAGATVAPKGFYDPTVTNLGDYHVKAGFDLPLMDLGSRARARERGGLDASAARWRAALETREAGLHAAGLALRLLRLQEVEEIQRRDIDWLRRLATLVRAGVRSGVRSAADSVRVALAGDAAAAGLETTLLDKRTTTLDLKTVLGRSTDGVLAIRPPATNVDRAPDPADSLGLLASVNRLPEVALARVAEARALLDVRDVQRRNRLAMDLSVDAGLAGADLTQPVPTSLLETNPDATFMDRLRRDLGASASLNLRLPVLDRALKRSTESRQAVLRAERVRREAEETAREREALALLAQWRSAFHRLQATQATSDLAETHLLKIKSLYTAGATTLLELLDARGVHGDARARLAEARENSRLAQFQVEDRK